VVPWLLLAGLGGYWLWQNDYFYPCLWLAVALYFLMWIGSRWLVKRQISPFSKLPVFQPDRLISPAAEAAWAKVEKMADALDTTEYSLGDPAKLIALTRRIIIEVSKRFNPNAKAAELDVPLSSILLIIERVSRDIRELLNDQVPASHLISIQDGLMLWRWKENLKKLGIVGNVGRMLTSPVAGMLHQSRLVFINRVTRYPLMELERWLLQTLARKLGYYAILLYSGELWMDDASEGKRTQTSAQDMENAMAREEYSPDEPLRILVAGQTKAGKSSLINALFGELRAPTDVLPSTYALLPYRLEQEGEFLGLVFDSPGFGDHVSWVEDSHAELQMIDLVLLASSAIHAGRAADSHFLETLRAEYAKTPDRIPPPVIVAVTHIDLLRPAREWKPPYNIGQPSGTKESQIRLCMEEVARTLAVPLGQVHAVCLKPGDEWNIEAVWTAIAAQLPQARRARYLRCLKDGRAREKWELILRQLGNAGRLIVVGVRKGLAGR
jgi:predicted GTPase